MQAASPYSQQYALRERRRALGLCLKCGAPNPEASTPTMCAGCAQKNRDHQHRLRAKKISAGLCTQCERPADAGRYCSAHAIRRRAITTRHYAGTRSNPELVIGKLVRAARNRCRASGRAFSITIEDLLPVPTVCSVLGIAIEYAYRPDSRGPRDNSPSIDRIDNSKGYERGNVRVISYRANRLRGDASLSEMRAILADAERAAATPK